MNRTSIIPTDKTHWHSMRASVLTSTKIAALFGYNAFMGSTPKAQLSRLWNEMKAGITDERKPNARMQYGLDQEDRIAVQIGTIHRWAVEKMPEFIQVSDWRIGSSYDWAIQSETGKIPFEIKTVNSFAFIKAWASSGQQVVKASPRVELQLQTQMLVGGFDRCVLGVETSAGEKLIGYRDANPLVQRMILDKAAEFWKAFDKDIPLPGIKVRKVA